MARSEAVTTPNCAITPRPYTIHASDALEVTVANHDGLGGTQKIGPDGRLDLGAIGRLRVEGRTAEEIASQVAFVVDEPAERVQVRVAGYNSQHIYLYGQIKGSQRSVPYQGPETVVHLLQRVGVAPGAATNDISVIRPRIGDGKPPQVFRVQVKNILSHRDETTNLMLQPFDEVYVGETRQSCLEKCIPPCMRPLFEAVCGLSRAMTFADHWLGPAEKNLPAALAGTP